MTKRERAAAAANWRCIARDVERQVKMYGCDYQFLCWHVARVFGIDVHDAIDHLALQPSWIAGLLVFKPEHGCGAWWTFGENDCRVIAAGLMAAMCETGEFDG